MFESLFNKVAGLQACNLIEKRLQHRCFPVSVSKTLRATSLKNICELLLLCVIKFAGSFRKCIKSTSFPLCLNFLFCWHIRYFFHFEIKIHFDLFAFKQPSFNLLLVCSYLFVRISFILLL